MESTQDPPTRVERIKRKAFDHPAVAVLVIAGGAIIAFSQISEAIGKLGSITAPNALELATANAKGEYSRQLTHAAYYRLTWANNFHARIRRNASSSDVDQAWSRYMDSVVDWSAELLNNEVLLEKYYGPDKKREFNECVDAGMKAVHRAMVSLRYASEPDSATMDSLLFRAEFITDDVMALVMTFSTGLQANRPQRTRTLASDSLYLPQCNLKGGEEEPPSSTEMP